MSTSGDMTGPAGEADLRIGADASEAPTGTGSAPAGPDGAPAHSQPAHSPAALPEHAGLRYAVLRVLMLLAVGGVLYLVGMRSWPWLFATVLISAVLSFFVFLRQREAAARSLEAALAARSARREEPGAEAPASEDARGTSDGSAG